MENNDKQVVKINSNVLKQISDVYVTDIEEISQYYPKHKKDVMKNLSEEAKTDIIETGRNMTAGLKSSIPMICRGKKCCLSAKCALLDNSIQPEGYPCPYEELMVDKLTIEYYKSLNIDPFNRSERDQIRQMIELIIIDNRTSADIANRGLYTMKAVGANNKGKPIFSEEESVAFTIKMRTQSRIERLQNELLATRKVKKQFDVDQENDPSSKASSLMEKWNNIVEADVIDDENEDQ